MIKDDVLSLCQLIQLQIHSAPIEVITIYKDNLIIYYFTDHHLQWRVLITPSHGFINMTSIYLIERQDTS